jgi:hypothetical protein
MSLWLLDSINYTGGSPAIPGAPRYLALAGWLMRTSNRPTLLCFSDEPSPRIRMGIHPPLWLASLTGMFDSVRAFAFNDPDTWSATTH